MRTNKTKCIVQRITALVLSMGLIAGSCMAFGSNGLVSLAAAKESDEESLHAKEAAYAEQDVQDNVYTETEQETDDNADYEAATPSELQRSYSESETENQLYNADYEAATPSELQHSYTGIKAVNQSYNEEGPDQEANEEPDQESNQGANKSADQESEQKPDQESQPETKYKALIIVSAEEGIAASTKGIGESLAAMLKRTNEFKNCSEGDISIMTFDFDYMKDDSDKQEVWNWIDEVADNQSSKSLTVIAYTGHGYYGNDGTAELLIGGDSSITAAELKSHTAKLNGDVMLILNACYAGGMIMPTAEGDENAELDISGLSEQAQTEADKFSKNFVSEFESAKAGNTKSESTGKEENTSEIAAVNAAERLQSNYDNEDQQKNVSSSANEPKYYIFAESSPYEIGWVTEREGSCMIAMMLSGLGYDRNDEYYDIISADTDCDYKVTMAELAAWVKSGGCISEPEVAPAGSKHVLFTYDKDSCNPAMFSIEAIGDKSIKVVDNKVTVNVLVHNYTEEEAELEFAAYKSNEFTPMPGNQSIEYIKAEWGDSVVLSSDPDTVTIKASGTTEGQLVFDGSKLTDKLTNGGKYVIKAYGSDDNTEKCFAFTSFTTTKGGSELAELPDKEALAIKSPACVSNALDAVKASQFVPLSVEISRLCLMIISMPSLLMERYLTLTIIRY